MRFVYEAPDDHTFLFDPTPEQLASLFREADHDYWQRGGNGEAAINIIGSPGEQVLSHRSLIRPDGVEIKYVAGSPSLWIKQPIAERFFFTLDDEEGWWSPYDGGDCSAYVMDERGGDPFKIPYSCLVDTQAAIKIATAFLDTMGRSPAVPWSRWNDLPLPMDWYDG
jgi:hypothetical protein